MRFLTSGFLPTPLTEVTASVESWLKSLENIQIVLIVHFTSHLNLGAWQGSILLSLERKLIFS
jgi:hypothetical protein